MRVSRDRLRNAVQFVQQHASPRVWNRITCATDIMKFGIPPQGVSQNVDRRRFLFLSLGGVGQLAYGAKAASPDPGMKKARIVMGEESLGQMPVDFTGLSYES